MPGPFGTMGVGVPFAVGAKAAHPDYRPSASMATALSGQNAMEAQGPQWVEAVGKRVCRRRRAGPQ